MPSKPGGINGSIFRFGLLFFHFLWYGIVLVVWCPARFGPAFDGVVFLSVLFSLPGVLKHCKCHIVRTNANTPTRRWISMFTSNCRWFLVDDVNRQAPSFREWLNRQFFGSHLNLLCIKALIGNRTQSYRDNSRLSQNYLGNAHSPCNARLSQVAGLYQASSPLVSVGIVWHCHHLRFSGPLSQYQGESSYTMRA